VTPAVNQVETHPFYQRAADQELMSGLGVQIESWGPFAEGRNNLFADPTLTAIAAEHDVTVAQVVLRWLTKRGVVAIPSPFSRTEWQRISTCSASCSQTTT
jgi:2,5-diketo-D-gluconate reductase A